MKAKPRDKSALKNMSRVSEEKLVQKYLGIKRKKQSNSEGSENEI